MKNLCYNTHVLKPAWVWIFKENSFFATRQDVVWFFCVIFGEVYYGSDFYERTQNYPFGTFHVLTYGFIHAGKFSLQYRGQLLCC